MNRILFRLSSFNGIEGLPLIIVLSNALVFLFNLVQPGLVDLLLLSHGAVSMGQWWRVVTYLFVPPFVGGGAGPLGVLLMVVWFMFLHTMVTSLEAVWGSGKFTIYFLAGWLATSLVALLPLEGVISNGYLQASLFLAFATLFPETEVLLFFIIPVQVRWMGYFTWGTLSFALWGGDTTNRVAIGASLINYFLILGPTLKDRFRLRVETFLNRQRFRGPR